MSKHDGGPAFPVSTCSLEGELGHPDGPDTCPFPGMSLRDWFAGQALAGLLAGGDANDWRPEERRSANAAASSYAYADAMLAERAKVGA